MFRALGLIFEGRLLEYLPTPSSSDWKIPPKVRIIEEAKMGITDEHTLPEGDARRACEKLGPTKHVPLVQ